MRIVINWKNPFAKTNIIIEACDENNSQVKQFVANLKGNPFIKIVKKEKYPLPF